MGLSSAMQIGRSALSASQLAIQVSGNNMANAATPGYSRQAIALSPTQGQRFANSFIGRGVQVEGIYRRIDVALQNRLWGGLSDEAAANASMQILSQVESTLGELSDGDLSSEMTRFFNAWSELANSPGTPGNRALVVQQGRGLASYMQRLRTDLVNVRRQIDRDVDTAVVRADQLLEEIAGVNTAIATAEAGTAEANGLRDQRDSLISELSQLVDVTSIEQPSGAVNVMIGSQPVIILGESRGIELDRESTGDDFTLTIRTKDNGSALDVDSGRVGALLNERETAVNGILDQLDALAGQLIFQVNRIHSAGYAGVPLTSVTGTTTVDPADTALALNDPANESFVNLPFAAVNGGFLVTVTNSDTGASQTVRVDVDLDGIDATGAPGFADDTSVDDIAAQLNGIANLSAQVNADGTLSIDAGPGYEFSLSEDDSGALAVLGINTYFTGENASDIAVRTELSENPQLLAAGSVMNGQPIDNGAALAISLLEDQPLTELNGSSLRGTWVETISSVGVKSAAASTRQSASQAVRANLEAQRAAVSGVNVDEEAIDLLTFQRQYQGAARFITVVDELTQELLALV